MTTPMRDGQPLYPPPPPVVQHVQLRQLWMCATLNEHLINCRSAETVEEVALQTHLAWLMCHRLERSLRQTDSRLVGRLYYRRGLSKAEIGRLLHISPPTLDRRLHRYKRLERIAAERGEEL